MVDLRSSRTWIAVVLVIVSLIGLGNFLYFYTVAQKFEQFHSTVCTLIVTSQKGSKLQVTYYDSVERRALLRAKVDKGTIQQADIDAAAQAHHEVVQYERGSKFHFPGC